MYLINKIKNVFQVHKFWMVKQYFPSDCIQSCYLSIHVNDKSISEAPLACDNRSMVLITKTKAYHFVFRHPPPSSPSFRLKTASLYLITPLYRVRNRSLNHKVCAEINCKIRKSLIESFHFKKNIKGLFQVF